MLGPETEKRTRCQVNRLAVRRDTVLASFLFLLDVCAQHAAAATTVDGFCLGFGSIDLAALVVRHGRALLNVVHALDGAADAEV